VVEHLERAAGFEREDLPEARLAKLEALLARGTDKRDQAVPLIAALLGVPTGGRYSMIDLTPQRQKELTLEALLEQLVALAVEQPVLVVHEDVHWIDPTTQELLSLAIERTQRLPVLMIITFRPEFVPPWPGQPHVSEVALTRLGRREGAAMVDKVVGDKVLPVEVSAQIVAKTDGVPLFVEELTKAVLESGLLEDRGDRYELAGPLPPFAIPATLHDSLLARLDRLAPVKEIAQIGAAIGREFSYALLAAVADRPEAELQIALGRLVSSELVFRRGAPPEAIYSFKHALVQDAAYGTLLKSRRQQLHARIVEVLEEQFPETADTQPERLAYHCTQAGLVPKAIDWWSKAGRQAIARSAGAEGVAQFQKGLELLVALPYGRERGRRELELQVALGGALLDVKGWAAAEVGRAYTRARELCGELGDEAHLFPVLWGLTAFHVNRAELPKSLDAAEELLRLAERQRDVALRLASHRAASTAFYHFGALSRARAHQEKMLALYDHDRDHSLRFMYAADFRVSALSLLSLTLLSLGYPRQAQEGLEEAVAYAQQLSHPRSLALALGFACQFCGLTRDLESLKDYAEAEISLSTAQGFPNSLRSARIHQSCVHALRGVEEGLALCTRELAAKRVSANERERPLTSILLAEAYQNAGQPSEGLRVLEEPLGRVAHTREGWIEAELHRIRGELLLPSVAEPYSGEAEACFQRALAVAREQSARMWELRAAMSLARLWANQGRRAEAHDLLAPVYGWFTEGFDTADLKDAKALLDELA
jgi:predicted ATPase